MPLDLAFHATLLDLLSKKSPTDVSDFLNPLVEQGLVDLSLPIKDRFDRDSSPVLVQWLSQWEPSQWGVSDLEQVQAWMGDAWWTLTDARKRPLLDLLIGQIEERSLSRLSPLVQALPASVWTHWQPPKDRYGKSRPQGVTPGAGLLDWVLRQARYGNEREQDFVHMLIERGADLTGRTDQGPVARHLHTPLQWSAFLAQGGNPLELVPHGDAAVPTPLWEALRSEHTHLRPVIEAWASENPALRQQAKQGALAHYFSSALLAHDTASLSKAIRKRDDWMTVKNAQGQSIFMALLAAKDNAKAALSTTETLTSQVKAKGSLALTDGHGRSFWHYLVASASGQYAQQGDPTRLMHALLAQGVIPRPDAHGRGLLLQGLPEWETSSKDNPELFHHRAFEVKWSDPQIKAALANPSVWLAGTPEDQQRVLTWMLEGRSFSQTSGTALVKSLHVLGGVLEVGGADAVWMGAFVLNALMDGTASASNYRADVRRWQEAGAMFPLTPQREAALRAHAANVQASDWVDQVLQTNTLTWTAYQRAQERQAYLQGQVVAPRRPRPRA